MKTVNIIFSNFYGEINAANNRINSFKNELIKKGYKVNIISNSLKKKNNIFQKQLNIYFIYQRKFSKNNFLKRAFDEIRISYQLVRKSNKITSDITILTVPSIFLIPIGLLVKGKKVLDIRDIQWEYLNNKLVKRILRSIMLFSLKKYNLIIVTNEYEYRYFQKYKINPILIPNGIDKTKFFKIESLSFSFEKEVTYIGNIGLAQNIMNLVKIAEMMKDVKFNIIGNGIEYEKIYKYIKQKNINNINLTGELEWEEILSYYKRSKLLFASLKDGFNSAMPSKLYEYASTGLPIVFLGDGESAKFINKLENSKVFNNNSLCQCKKYIREIIKKDEIDISFKNRDFIKKNFLRENNAKKLIKYLERT